MLVEVSYFFCGIFSWLWTMSSVDAGVEVEMAVDLVVVIVVVMVVGGDVHHKSLTLIVILLLVW